MNTPRVLIISDDVLARAGLNAALSPRHECVAVGQTRAGRELQAALDAYQPDVLLWDLGWEGAVSIAQIGELRLTAEERVQPPIVALAPDAETGMDAWRAGVSALLPREVATEVLLSTILGAYHGLLVIHPDLATALRPHTDAPGEQPFDPLTPRELEVLQLMAEGLTNKAIARQLEISEHTVKFHINTILSKLYASSRTEAVVRATRAGLILL
ncbi:MAG: response regulator transcription factor [Caldilineaceae bacterium]